MTKLSKGNLISSVLLKQRLNQRISAFRERDRRGCRACFQFNCPRSLGPFGNKRADQTGSDKTKSYRNFDEEVDIPQSQVVNVPVIGKVTAGSPITAVENIEEYFRFQTEWFP